MNKKGIELSVNFLVTIIIALVIFGFGVKFVYNLASGASEMESLTTDDLDERIGDLLCESADKVCIGVNRKVIPRGEFDVFGIKVINVIETAKFRVVIEPRARIDKQGKIIDAINDNNIDKIEKKYNNILFELKRNEERNLGVGFGVPKDKGIEPGTYIFDVTVIYIDTDLLRHPLGTNEVDYDTNNPIYKIYVEVP